jgi:hypothetical protein
MNSTFSSPLIARVYVALVLLLLFCGTSTAQTPGAGSLEGRVFDAGRGEYLENARVTVEGTTLEVLTDSSGSYRLTNVPAGTAKVRVFFTGIVSPVETVSISPNQVTVGPGRHREAGRLRGVDDT